MPPARAAAKKDVAAAGLSPDELGEEVVRHVAAKGFCIVDAGLGAGLLEKAAQNAAELDQRGELKRPSELVAQGLLGLDGSARIALLDADPDEAEAAVEDDDGLQALDRLMGDYGEAMEPFMPLLGFTSDTRTPAVLNETGLPDTPEMRLDERQASRWIFEFTRQVLMVLVFLGPSNGTLLLTPFEERVQDAEEYEIETEPGSIVVLRSDTLEARLAAGGKALTLTCFFLSKKTVADKRNIHMQITPAARAMQDWAIQRLDELKAMDEDEKHPDVPREWLVAMNQQCFKGQHMACRGMAIRHPTTWDPDAFYLSTFSGADMVTEVPFHRWDHAKFYDPNPVSWQWLKTCQKHTSCMEGAEMFDCKMFSISPAEARVMDPQQRIQLEVGYEALHNSGMKRGQIMNSLGGIYLGYGSATSDFSYIDKSTDAGAEGSFGATGGSAAITANRFSFCLGMKGPSIAVDAEDASALVAVHMGCEGLQAKGRGTRTTFALCGGMKINMATYYWTSKQAAGLLSAAGRCLTFDASADGFVHGDGGSDLCLKPLTEIVEGETVVTDGLLVGVVASSTVNSNGHTASMSAPDSVGLQECLATTLKCAGLSGFDLPAVETFGVGMGLLDAIEASACMRVLRLSDECADSLQFTSLKTQAGNMNHACGSASLIKAMFQSKYGTMWPNLHLSQMNPHIDAFSQPMNFLCEALEFPLASSYTFVLNNSMGGTNAAAVAWGRHDEERNQPPPRAPQHERLIFWPGGGGRLEPSATPRRGYHLAGTCTAWTPVPMEIEESGIFGFTITLSENRWEQFQIWMDGDVRKSLFPEEHKAPSHTSVLGPDPVTGGKCWRIDGRPFLVPSITSAADGGPLALADVTTATDAPSKSEAVAAAPWMEAGLDRALVGAAFRVRLHVAGKYRMVDWVRLSGKVEDPAELDRALENAKSLPPSTYQVTADWNGWGFEGMAEVERSATSTLFSLEVQLPYDGGEFQIVRNRDWQQVMCPSDEDPAQVHGPDDNSEGRAWSVDGQPGDVIKIDLRRSWADGLDHKEVTWTKLEARPLTEAQLVEINRTRYAIFGSWDDGQRLRELKWTGSCYHCFIELGANARESFQLVEDLDWNRVVFASKADAHPGDGHAILGPSPADGRSAGLCWTIGMEGFETAGDTYEVKVTTDAFRRASRVTKVEWQRVARGTDMSGAEAAGLVLRGRA